MKPVDINGRFLTQPVTGVQRYASQLVQALDRQLADSPGLRARCRVRILTPTRGARALELEHISVEPVGKLRGNPWEQLELPAYVRGLLLNLCNTAPLVRPAVVTIHDASVFAVPDAYSRAFRTWYRILLPFIGRRALRVITSSRFSRAELSRWAGILEQKVEVIALGGEHIVGTPADPAVFQRLPVQNRRYILAVGSRSPHKNLSAVAEAIRRLGPDAVPLVLAGGFNARIFAETTGLNDRACYDAGYVTDGELRALYENAGCFVFPSLYEGFGLPALEAMVCGCPAVVARAASMPEVCGEAVLYCDPRNPEDIAVKIRTVMGDPALREELRRRGFERAAKLTWRNAAASLMQTLERIGAV
jgi:glycosyltransferase involved in cell wall biosynthesis